MASFIKDTQINLLLEEFINEAEKELVLICPYFKLHDRLKDCLKLRKEDHNLTIIIVFGKNPYELSKSLSKQDFEFLKSFPNIDIAYEKRLHAKYYANDKRGLITSLNLYTSSHNNNIEVGVIFNRKGTIKNLADKTLGGITSLISDTEDLAFQAHEYFLNVYTTAEKIFQKQSRFKNGFLNLTKQYTHSETLIDNSDWYYKHIGANIIQRNFTDINSNKISNNSSIPENGFCISTGEEIPFDPFKPYSRNAYYKRGGDIDFKEKYCHGCGGNHATSFRDPLCTECSKIIA